MAGTELGDLSEVYDPDESHEASLSDWEKRADGNDLSEYAATVELIRGMRDQATRDIRPQVRHWLMPASRVSADFFCAAEHPKFGWFGLLTDASGHGLPAAIFALHMPMLFREAVLLGLSLPAIYTRINQVLMQQRISGYFVCGILIRVQERDIEIINAGMPDALLLAADGRLAEAFRSRYVPFGIDDSGPAHEITPQRYRLLRDEQAALLLYSDGLSELGILAGAALGRDGLLDAAKSGAESVFDRLVQGVEARAAEVHDDVSLALIPVPLDVDRAAPDMAAPVVAKNRAAIDAASVRRIVEHIDRGLVLTDAEQRILYVNPAFTALTGYTLEEAVGQTPRMLSSGRHDRNFYQAMWQALKTQGAWSGEIWNRRKDGSLYLEWLDLRALHDREGGVTNYLASFAVITKQKEQEERLRFMALHDSLTGLANRSLLIDRGQQAMLRADRSDRSMAVLFIDLDRFKTINETLGHDIGDEVLVTVAARFSGVLREDDTLARVGGDQFVCLLPDVAARQDAALVCNKLLAVLDKPIKIAGHKFKIGASIGISAYPSDGRLFDDLLVEADRAMMRAKQAGGNLYKFFSAEMAAAVERQLEIEARLDAAIREGRLELFYQPKLDLATRRIIGAEALVRWRDPKDGLIPPGVFIPVAEKSDLIAKIGTWVLQQACRVLARRSDSLPEDFHVAVNVSPMQFERCDIPGEVARVLDESGVPARRLQLEVTESMLIRDTEGVAEMLRQVAAQGVCIALDDFGTGYSNLASLSQLPLHAFKLDQRFVRGVDSNQANASIASSVCHLAVGLGKHVVAEGIETCEECVKLMKIGYRIGQGYRYGRPLPEDEFFALLACGVPDCDECKPLAKVKAKVKARPA